MCFLVIGALTEKQIKFLKNCFNSHRHRLRDRKINKQTEAKKSCNVFLSYWRINRKPQKIFKNYINIPGYGLEDR